MADTSDQRALALWLGERGDDELTRLFAARGVSPSAPWHGFFDAAEGLLDAASIDRAIARLPRTDLAALAAGTPAPTGSPLRLLALVDADGLPYAAVRARVDEAAATTPAAFTAPPPAPAPRLADPAAQAAAAERALTAVAALSDIALAARDGLVATTAAGAVSASDRRRLIDEGVVSDGDELDDILDAAADAGLMHPVDREWRLTVSGEAWLPASAADRWMTVAEGLRDHLPSGVRTGTHGYVPPDAWAGVHPLDPEWPERVRRLQRRAVRWGLLTGDGAEPAWGRALREGGDAASALLAPLLPAEIDRVYLQADLSAIAPGPLRADLDLRLRTMATRESRAQASSYRFGPDSLAAAVAAGETAASLRDFLGGLSLTGIPQPLDYLIERAARRQGVARVGWDAAAARTRVDADDAQLRETLAVDRGLRALGLVPDGDAMLSRLPRDTVYWALVDARYPAVAVGETGQPEPLARRTPVAAASADADYAALLSALRSAAETDTDAAWLARELDQAVRARAVIEVDVRMPDGSVRAFTLEASGIGGGRLRGLDRAADVERTLPVSSIVSVRPAA